MSQKRKHADATEPSSSTPKPFKKHRAFKPGQSHSKPKKRPHVSSDIDKSTSTHALKSRIRDLRRLLAHVDNVGDHKMSASNRIERERELEACQHELQEKLESTREAEYRKKIIGKYHHNAEVDVNYSIYYPLLKPYASLYPKSKKSKASDSDDANEEDVDDKANRDVDGPKGDLDMWKSVEVAMAEGTLDALRNRKEDMPALVPKKEKKTKEQLQPQRAVKFKEKKVEEKLAAAKNRRERRALGVQAQEEAEESDGGFFE